MGHMVSFFAVLTYQNINNYFPFNDITILMFLIDEEFDPSSLLHIQLIEVNWLRKMKEKVSTEEDKEVQTKANQNSKFGATKKSREF